jgi:hypothetical protein
VNYGSKGDGLGSVLGRSVDSSLETQGCRSVNIHSLVFRHLDTILHSLPDSLDMVTVYNATINLIPDPIKQLDA